MDKNMINIDDLLKERLTGGEEKERPGAWLQMRDLLDKEMPVTKAPVAAVNWRRMFGYMAALLLLSAVSIGGYQMAVTERAEKAAYDEVAVNIPATTNGNPHSNATSNNSTANNNELGDTSNPFRTKKKQGDASTVSLDKAGKQGDSKNASVVTANATNNTKHSNKTGALKTTEGTTTNNNKSSVSNNTAKNEKGRKLLDDNRKNALIASAALENSNPTPVIDKKIAGKADQKQETLRERQYASGKSLGNKNNTKLKEDKKIAVPAENTENTSGNSKIEEFAANTASAGKDGAAKNKKPGAAKQADYLVGKQMVSKIEIRETYDRKLGKKIDTISTGRTEMEILTPVEKTSALSSSNTTAVADMPTTTNTVAKISEPAKRKRPLITVTEEDNNSEQIVPSSSIVLSAGNVANTDNLVPLSNFKVSTKQSSNYARTNLIEQMIQNAKVNIGSAKFYGGIVGGVNTSLSGNNSMSGFQLGVSGTLSLNERWGIVSELKYMHRFNSNPFKNDGYANLDSSARINGVITYTWDSVNRSFKFPTVSAMELPVYIRYSLNRLNFHAGMNLIYNFTVNNIDVDSVGIRKINNEGPVMEGAVNYSFANGVPRVSVDDFSSRFSLGYLFGIGYQFTPAIQLDVRMTKSVWDNAKTPGAKEVSKKLYDVPSVQINLNYRFSNNKFRPYHSR